MRYLQADATATWRVLDGVIEKIDYYVFHSRLVPLNIDAGRGVANDGDVLVLCKQAHLIRGSRSEFPQIKGNALGIGLPGIQPGKRQQSLNDLCQPIDLF